MSLVNQIAAALTAVGHEIKALVRPDHSGLAKAWVSFGYVGTAIQIYNSLNVANVTRLATGNYRITFSTPFADAHYCWLATGRSNTTSGSLRFASARTSEAKTIDTLEIVCATNSNTLADSSEINVVVFR
jgi:hypothetical protein